jgi:tetratricopeptide (TPR) repeat protein
LDRKALLCALFFCPFLATFLAPSLAVVSDLTATEYRSQGLADRQAGNLPGAIAALEKSVQLEPENLDGRVILGWTLHLAGQEEQAATVLRENLRRNLNHVPTLNALGIVYLVSNPQSQTPNLLQEKPLWAAVITHSRAALLEADNEVAFYNLALAFERLEIYEGAIAAAERAIELEPYNPHPLVALAIVYQDQNKTDAAQEVYGRAIALDGRYTDSGFLGYLNEAGFSKDQIQKAQAILSF